MMPSVRKSATLANSDTWRKERRLRLHHACIVHVADTVNRFYGEDKHVLCADGQVRTCFIIRTYIVYTCIYWFIFVCTCMYHVCTCFSIVRNMYIHRYTTNIY